MDVRCSNCGTEYEFDESKVTPAGVTVKCTTCGHVFKVKKEAEAPPQLGAPDGAEWMVRRPDGRTYRFKELTTLQKWIVEQKVSRDDLISKTGKSWKPLGDIAELASFFQVVDAARAAQSMPPGFQTPPHTPMPSMPSPSMPPQPAPVMPAPGTYPPGMSNPGMPAAPGSVPPQMAGAPPPQVGGPMPGQMAGQPSVPPGYPGGAAPGGQYPPGGGGPAAQMPAPLPPQPTLTNEGFFDDNEPSLTSLDEDDPVRQWKRRGRAKKAAALLLVLVVGGVVGLYFAAPKVFFETFGPLLVKAGITLPGMSVDLSSVDQALASDVEGTLQKELGRIAGKLDDDPVDPAVVAAGARLHAAIAQIHAERARLFELLDRKDEAQASADQHDEELGESYALASRAMQAGQDRAWAHVAQGAYKGLKGAVDEMSADLENARAKAAGDTVIQREATVIGATSRAALALRAGDADALTAAKQALDAAEAQAGDDDARVAYARLALRAAGADDKTRKEVQNAIATFSQANGDHERARLLAEWLGKQQGEAKPTPKKPRRTESYSSLLKKADRARLSDKSAVAAKLYKRALAANPNSSEAWLGLGWSSLDLEQSSRSISAFDKAIDIDPRLAEAYFGRAEAQRAAGKNKSAARNYERYLQLAPGGPDAPIAKRALERLE